MSEFTIKDSGERESFDSGMVRDTEDGKIDYSLIFDGPMVDRWAEHLTKGAKKYAPRNWMKATGEAELDRFRRSFLRHMRAWIRGDLDEDHAAAMVFNINGFEYVRGQMMERAARDEDEQGRPLSIPRFGWESGAKTNLAHNSLPAGFNLPLISEPLPDRAPDHDPPSILGSGL